MAEKLFTACRLAIILLAAIAAAAAWASSFFNNTGTAQSITYTASGYMRETLQWDAANSRFLVSRFEGGISQIVPSSASASTSFHEQILLPLPPNLKGNSTIGFRVDLPRNRVLAVHADVFGRSFSALAAYDLSSWQQLFLAQLDSPGKRMAEDVAVDDQGNAYVTDAHGNIIWKVTVDGGEVSIISNSLFTSLPHKLPVYIAGLNGIEYHPGGFLLVAHTTSGALFKVELDGSKVEVVEGLNLAWADGMVLLSPEKLVVAGIPAKMVESSDGWKSARVTHTFYGPFYRLLTSVTVKESKVFANYILGWNSFTIKEAVFKLVPE